MIELLAADRTLDVMWRMLIVLTVKSTILLAIGFACARLLRDGHGAARAKLWAGAMLALAVLPLFAGWLPSLPLPVADFPRVLFQRPDWSVAAGGSSVVTAGGPATIGTLPAVAWAFFVWAAGALLLLVRFVIHSAAVRSLARGALSCPPACARALASARDRLGVRRVVRVAITSRAPTPLVFGWFRPTILLPADAATWSPGRLDAVLCHEIAHVRRADYAWLVLTELLHALYWPNPLFRRARSALRLEQDKACDGAAVRAGFGATDYAEQLLALARALPRTASHAVLPLLTPGHGSPLAARIRALLDREAHDHQPRPAANFLAATILLAGMLFLAAADPWICEGGSWPVIELPGIVVH